MNPATPGAMYDAGGVSGATKENARIPAAVSQAGTNAAIPASGMIRCSSGFQRRPGPRLAEEAKYPMQAAFKSDRDCDEEGDKDGHHRRAVPGKHPGRHVGESPDPAHRIAGPAGHVETSVGVRDGRVDDGQEHEEPE